MVKKLSDIYKYLNNITTPATSRWGFVNTLLAGSAIFIAIGAWKEMDWLVALGVVVGVSAIILGIIWLFRGSKDPTATKDDINKLKRALNKSSNRQTKILGNKLDVIIGLLRRNGKDNDKEQ